MLEAKFGLDPDQDGAEETRESIKQGFVVFSIKGIICLQIPDHSNSAKHF